jgi:hypothetical protein
MTVPHYVGVSFHVNPWLWAQVHLAYSFALARNCLSVVQPTVLSTRLSFLSAEQVGCCCATAEPSCCGRRATGRGQGNACVSSITRSYINLAAHTLLQQGYCTVLAAWPNLLPLGSTHTPCVSVHSIVN